MNSSTMGSCCGNMNSSDATASSCEIPSETGVNMTPTLSLFLIGVTGNLVALVVLQKRRPSKSRTLFYTLLTGLILNDLLAQLLSSSAPLLVYGMGVFNETSKRLRLTWMGGRTACQIHAMVMTAVWLGEPLLVLCMSAERLLCLTRWQSYSRMHHKQRRTALGMLFGLIGVLVVASLPLTGLVGIYRLQYPGTWCFLDSRGDVSLRHRVFAAVLALWDLLAVAMIVACNLWVIRCLLTVRKTRKTLSEAAADVSVANADRSTTAGVAVGAAGTGRAPKHMRYMEVQLVVLLIAITASFGLCWTPLMLRVLINSLFNGSDCRRDLSAVHLASINQILDPWLYILLRRSNFLRLWQLLRRGAAFCGCAAASDELDNAERRRRLGVPQHLAACRHRRQQLEPGGADLAPPPPPTRIDKDATEVNGDAADAASRLLQQLEQQQVDDRPMGRQRCCNCSCHQRNRKKHHRKRRQRYERPLQAAAASGSRQRYRSLPELQQRRFDDDEAVDEDNSNNSSGSSSRSSSGSDDCEFQCADATVRLHQSHR